MPDSLGHTPSPSPSRKQPLPPGQTVPHFGGTAYGSQFPQERSVKWGSRQQRTRERTVRPFSGPKVHFRAIPDARDAQGCPRMPTDARFWIQPSVNNPLLSTGNAQHLLSPLKLSQREKKKSCHHPPLPQAPPGCDVCVLQTGRDEGDGFLLEGDSCTCHC